MPVAKPESSDARVIAHVDMDCFYVQVEQRKRPELKGIPTAVVQYNSWKGGGLIAVGYEARKFGVKRSMRGDEAKEVCPDIQLVQVPVARDKADLTTYREAGSEVVSILSKRGRCERASIDEVYLDLTDAAETMLAESPPESLEIIDEEALKSHVLGLNFEDGDDWKENVREWMCRSGADRRDKLLACGALIVSELRKQVLQETQFTCSAGIAHNKMLAKLASGMNKPAQQTVVPFSSVKALLESLPIKKMKQLGGKLGSSLQSDLGVNTVGDLLQFSEEKLQERYGVNTGTWLWNIARGVSGEEVEGRLLPKSHGSGKTFPGPRALKTLPCVQNWLKKLSEELSERLQSDLDNNRRIAHTLILNARAYKINGSDSQKKFPSKSCTLRYGAAKILEDAVNLFQAGLREYLGSTGAKNQGGWRITGLSVSASKILAVPSGTHAITKYFSGTQPTRSTSKPLQEFNQEEASSVSFSEEASGSALYPTEVQMELLKDGSNARADSLNPDELKCASENDLDQVTSYVSEAEVSTSDKDYFPEQELIEPKKALSDEERSKWPKPTFLHQQVRKKPSVDKGTSILKFFRKLDPCSSLQTHDQAESIPALESGLPSASGTCSKNQFELPKESYLFGGESSSQRAGQKRESWQLTADEIDPSVMNELPLEIQEELRSWIRPQKRSSSSSSSNAVKRGSITHYFSGANHS